jgi:hypothetical protein
LSFPRLHQRIFIVIIVFYLEKPSAASAVSDRRSRKIRKTFPQSHRDAISMGFCGFHVFKLCLPVWPRCPPIISNIWRQLVGYSSALYAAAITSHSQMNPSPRKAETSEKAVRHSARRCCDINIAGVCLGNSQPRLPSPAQAFAPHRKPSPGVGAPPTAGQGRHTSAAAAHKAAGLFGVEPNSNTVLV